MKNKQFMMLAIFCGVSALAGFIMMKGYGAVAGAIVGLLIPGFLAKHAIEARRVKFNNQLIDAVMLVSSCLKAGLSFNQAIEVLVQEMEAPISEEFAIVLKSIRIGVPLDEAFAELVKRVPEEELKFLISAILVARETGGDLPTVLIKLVDTLRDRNRLKENIATYTIQGKVQGIVMGMIPIVFVFVVLQQDPHHFDVMWTSSVGKFLIGLCFVLQFAALIFIMKISKVDI